MRGYLPWTLSRRKAGVPLAAITAKKAGFQSLSDTWADTTTSHGRFMLTVFGGLAEVESDLIRARTGEGRARAATAGRKWGNRSSSPVTRIAGRSSAEIKATRLPTSGAATTSARRRFHASRHKAMTTSSSPPVFKLPNPIELRDPSLGRMLAVRVRFNILKDIGAIPLDHISADDFAARFLAIVARQVPEEAQADRDAYEAAVPVDPAAFGALSKDAIDRLVGTYLAAEAHSLVVI